MKFDIEKIKQYFLKRDNLIILILTGILLLVIAWPIEQKNTEKQNNMSELWYRNDGNMIGTTAQENALGNEGITDVDMQQDTFMDSGIVREEYIIEKLEQRLETILTAMQGVGKVKVMITLSSSGEKVVEKDIPLERNNIIENDSTGGNRNTNEMYSQEETVYKTNSAGDKIPYVVKENSAVVAGVSVVAEGGDNSLVQKNISDAIQALFGIDEHKIKVVKMKQDE